MSRRVPLRERVRAVVRAFTLIEMLAATVIVGVLLIVVVNTVVAAKTGQRKTSDRATGARLAQQLMAEILQHAYEDPDGTPVFGPETGEAGGTRAAFDDVDDYHGWVASPPQRADGTVIPDRADWQRTVTVDYVDPTNLTTTVGTDGGVKRIVVEVIRGDLDVGTLTMIRTTAWQ